jgi:hypothetical protein
MRYFICLMIGAILAFLGRYWLVEAESAATSVAAAVSFSALTSTTKSLICSQASTVS